MSITKRKKLLNLLLLLTSLLGYLEWGAHKEFLFEIEYDLIHYWLFTGSPSADELTHPAVVMPLVGQVLLLITLFQKTPSRRLMYFGMAGIGALMLFIMVVGIAALRWKIFISALPFIITAIAAIRADYKSRQLPHNKATP